MNTQVSFESAKMLKEKGFNEPCYHYYYNNKLESSSKDNWNALNGYSAPTIVDVVMWLYEKHGIWIVPDFANKTQWYFDCNKVGVDGKEKRLYQSNYDYNSPTEAYEEAIKYTLKNLIP